MCRIINRLRSLSNKSLLPSQWCTGFYNCNIHKDAMHCTISALASMPSKSRQKSLCFTCCKLPERKPSTVNSACNVLQGRWRQCIERHAPAITSGMIYPHAYPQNGPFRCSSSIKTKEVLATSVCHSTSMSGAGLCQYSLTSSSLPSTLALHSPHPVSPHTIVQAHSHFKTSGCPRDTACSCPNALEVKVLK